MHSCHIAVCRALHASPSLRSAAPSTTPLNGGQALVRTSICNPTSKEPNIGGGREGGRDNDRSDQRRDHVALGRVASCRFC